LILSVPALDDFVEQHILRLFANRNLNLDVPQFADRVPTAENIALVVADLIQRHWPDHFDSMPARVRRVHIQETDRNGFEILLGVSGHEAPIPAEMESVTVHG
jgi:6-pyruvoyltetrahydropterin/6-carboxytetrahydropterin synthase